MTEQPDTAVIRAEWGEGWPGVEVLIPLCDALDGARAERDGWRKASLAMTSVAADQRVRSEAAEARIAAALELHRTNYGRRCVTCFEAWPCHTSRVLSDDCRALTGGTE